MATLKLGDTAPDFIPDSTEGKISPMNWKDGNDVVIVPSIQEPAELAQRFPKGFTAVKPCLRITPQPNK